MLMTLPSAVRIYLATEPVDLRRGFDGLAAATRTLMGLDPLCGHVFVFLNRRRNRVKLLAWGPTGYTLIYRRLEKGTFKMPTGPAPGQTHVEVDAGELGLMLEGLDLRKARRRKRWRPLTQAAAGSRSTAAPSAPAAPAPSP
jgi:transposase